jgi:hypothetical protein
MERLLTCLRYWVSHIKILFQPRERLVLQSGIFKLTEALVICQGAHFSFVRVLTTLSFSMWLE